jgi:hypothetical protein
MGNGNVLGGAEKFNAVEKWHLAFARYDMRAQAISAPEVGVTDADHTPKVAAVSLVVEEVDHRLGYRAFHPATPIGGEDEDVGGGGFR